MPVNNPLHLLRLSDPARHMQPLPAQKRQELADAILAADLSGMARRKRTRIRPASLVTAVVVALTAGVGVAWAADVISPLSIFTNSPQQQDAVHGSLWDQQVLADSITETATVEIPRVGSVGFWYGTSKQGGWCGALRLPNKAWVGTGTDPVDAGGSVPGCMPTRTTINTASGKPVYVINGFDYQEGDLDARRNGGSFWRIRYGQITAPGAMRIEDLVSGRTTVVHRHVFALAIPDPNPQSATNVHLVAYNADGAIVSDDCPTCGR